MTRFLANITEMTRLETGDIAPLLEALDVREAVEGASLRVPGLAGLLLEIPPGIPKIRADPALFEQVLVNILENAAKYASVGSPVMVTARKSGRDILVSIADSGPGISMVDLPHIFDSFYRARLGDRTIPGTGLGLAIARGLVEAMGGTIEALSPRPGAPSSGAPGTSIELRMRAAGD